MKRDPGMVAKPPSCPNTAMALPPHESSHPPVPTPASTRPIATVLDTERPPGTLTTPGPTEDRTRPRFERLPRPAPGRSAATPLGSPTATPPILLVQTRSDPHAASKKGARLPLFELLESRPDRRLRDVRRLRELALGHSFARLPAGQVQRPGRDPTGMDAPGRPRLGRLEPLAGGGPSGEGGVPRENVG